MTTPASEAAERQSRREQAERDWVSWLILRELFGTPLVFDMDAFYERLKQNNALIVRDCECLSCRHLFVAHVRFGYTANLSGELKTYCPHCNSANVMKGPQR